jgi:hypothetical protein
MHNPVFTRLCYTKAFKISYVFRSPWNHHQGVRASNDLAYYVIHCISLCMNLNCDTLASHQQPSALPAHPSSVLVLYQLSPCITS